MSAEPVPVPRPPDNSSDLIGRFRAQYADALASARESAEHTATVGWHRLYQRRREEARAARRALAKRMRVLADRMEDFGLGEDEDKDLREVAKDAAALREDGETFRRQTVDPVREPVAECERLSQQFLAAAVRQEQDAPLVFIGLVDLMRTEIAASPRPTWDDETGTVLIEPPATRGV